MIKQDHQLHYEVNELKPISKQGALKKKIWLNKKKIICLNDFLWFKEMICLNETKFVWFKQNILGPNKYLFESNKFLP